MYVHAVQRHCIRLTEPSFVRSNSVQIFAPIGQAVESEEASPVTEIESMCMNCGETGTTRLMMTAIPFFREVILMSFDCEHCGESNNEIQFGGKVQEKGCRYEFTVTTPKDMNRQVIKSDSATILVPSLEFEIPPAKEHRMGEITTIEGVLSTAAQNLALMQAKRREVHPELADKVAEVITQLAALASGDEEKMPFKIVVDDPAGNSFVENPNAPRRDPHLVATFYTRTPEQNAALGFNPTGGAEYKENEGVRQLMDGEEVAEDIGRREVLRFPGECPSCHRSGESLMCITEIPHFKEIIIMAFDCEFCGFKNNDIKGGGAIPTLGTSIVLTCENEDDFKRDVLKSDSARLVIPELEVELDYGSLGGVYTTVEGLLQKIKDNLIENNPFFLGDSSLKHHGHLEDMDQDSRRQFENFLNRFQNLIDGHAFPFHIELRDPLGNSFVSARIGSTLAPEEDPQITMQDYERDDYENEMFGIADMVVDNYDSEGNRIEPGAQSETDRILADRLTQVYRKAPDHPHQFTKGTEDTVVPLAGQAPLRPGQTTEKAALDAYYEQPDDEASFEPAATFQGRKEGKVFRTGKFGTGYYKDKYPADR